MFGLNNYQKTVNIIILLILSIPAIALPLSIFFEFNSFDRYLFYFKLYPHMILFPLFCFLIIGINLYQAFLIIKTQNKLIRNKFFIIFISLIVSFLLSYVEITSNNLMLFELSDTAISNITVSSNTIEELYEIPDSIIGVNSFINGDNLIINKSKVEIAINNFINSRTKLNYKQKKGYYKLMKISLSYSTWKNEQQEFSFSRSLYVLSFFIIVFVSLINWIFLFLYSKLDVVDAKKYTNYLIVSSLLFCTWLPLRLYYNLITKNILFGTREAIGQLDIFAFLICFIYFYFVCRKIFQTKKDRISRILIASTLISLTLIGRFKPEWVSLIFGINSNPILWIIFLVIAIICSLNLLKTTKMVF